MNTPADTIDRDNNWTKQATPPVRRLVRDFGAHWVSVDTVQAWAAQGGDCVLLLAGDAVRFPEGQDVAAVLPELMKAFPNRFHIGVVPREQEEAMAGRYGSQRWPTLLFLRDGSYVTTIAGMQDWDVYLQRMAEALEMSVSRAPTVGIRVVSSVATGSTCH